MPGHGFGSRRSAAGAVRAHTVTRERAGRVSRRTLTATHRVGAPPHARAGPHHSCTSAGKQGGRRERRPFPRRPMSAPSISICARPVRAAKDARCHPGGDRASPVVAAAPVPRLTDPRRSPSMTIPRRSERHTRGPESGGGAGFARASTDRPEPASPSRVPSLPCPGACSNRSGAGSALICAAAASSG